MMTYLAGQGKSSESGSDNGWWRRQWDKFWDYFWVFIFIVSISIQLTILLTKAGRYDQEQYCAQHPNSSTSVKYICTSEVVSSTKAETFMCAPVVKD